METSKGGNRPKNTTNSKARKNKEKHIEIVQGS